MNIGFIGLGIMGSRMAANLQKKGFNLVVFNRTPAKAVDLLANGAVWAGTPAGVAWQVDTLITMLAEPEAVAQMALGAEGFLPQLKPGSLWIDCSTVNPSFSRKMAAEAAARQIRFLDAPVAGTKQPAETGHLRFLVGGEADAVAAARPLFEAMGQQVIHVGGQGMGISLKIVFNMMLAEAMLTFAEALTLGQALGLSRDMLLNVIPGSPVAAPFITGEKKAKIEHGDYEADFPLQWMYKDLQMAALSAYEQDVALPLANTAKEIYALAKRHGLGEQDFAAICRFIEEQQAG